ncbi:hypothetical protein N7460_007811 [Penicillium canescens]|uniref:HAT C-terminal dimerisation domain-containing protein n=1 Tax=Penicillium canescens TaxID=5083 RepID=A0AAD6I8Q1_PENCN|nr:hypothetical protein N7460_007811 [Penicillium canescens]
MLDRESKESQGDEIQRYLDSGTVKEDPLEFWRKQESSLPALASAARDVLSIPATGAGVERLFNSARDICHYRRGSLKPTSIQDLMMYLCSARFELTGRYLETVKQDRFRNEKEAEDEEVDADGGDDYIDGISDTEEQDTVSNPSLGRLTTEVHSQQALFLGNQAGDSDETSVASKEGDADEESDDGLVLPLPEGIGRKRSSGRICRPSKRLKEFETY